MKARFSLLCAATLSAGLCWGAIRAVTPVAWDNGSTNSWQLKRHNAKMKEVSAGGAKVVFVGDSITHFWEADTFGKEQLRKYFSEGDWRMLDLGTSADRTEHVLWRLEHGELDGYEASCVVLMIGTNNTGHFEFAKEPPADTILGVRAVLNKIREKQPNAIVVLHAIFPRGEGPSDPNRLRNDVVNREIQRFCDGKTVFWCDLADDFLEADGTLPKAIFPDGLHPRGEGYERWYKGVKPYVDYALSDRTGRPPANRHAVSAPKLEGASTTVPATRIRREGYGRRDWWLDRLLEKRNAIADSKGRFDVVLVGDSITHNWEDKPAIRKVFDELRAEYSVLDLGYSGDRTEHVLWRLTNGEMDGYETPCVVLMIGTNNTGSKVKDSPEDIAAGVKKILETIALKQPKATVILHPIFPRGDSATSPQRVNNEKANAIIRTFADGQKVIWLDFNDRFLDEKGDVVKLMPDRLHPSPEGHRIWLEALRPAIRKICGK